MLELPPQVIQALLDAGVPRDEVIAAWSSLSGSARHGLGLARRLLERGAAQPAQLERALGGAPRPAQPLRQFAGYEVLRPLGRGAMGQVHLVRDAQGRSFALKTLAEVDEPVLIQRFQREVRTMCALSHPHLVRLHDAGVLGRTPYLVMDLYPGGSLQEHLARGPLDPEVARGIAGKLASALDAVHAQGLVHRDVKPENVLFDQAGEPRLADFGLATAGERSIQGGRLTLSADVLGTPAYMAPEQALDAKDVGPAADVYALGGVLYAMLTGKPPFAEEGNTIQVLAAVINTPPAPPHKLAAGIPLTLSELCVHALAKDPRARPAGAAEFAALLSAARPPRAFSWAVIAPALLALSALLALGVVAWQQRRAPALPPAATPADPPRTPVPGPTPLALARAGLLSAAWAAWALEEPHDASWTKRGELLLLAGATPSAPELEALDLDPSTSSEWLVFLAARDMLSPRDVKHFPGRAAQHWDYVCAAQRLHFAPSDLRLSFVSLDPAPRIARIANQLERDAQTLLAMARRARFEFEVDAPAQAALLDLLIMPLAEIAIYRARRLDDDPRIPFDRSYRVETVLEVRESLPPGSGRDALEVAAIALPKIRGFERDRGITERRPHARAFVRAMQPLCFERLNRLSVQIRVWCMWWLLECRKFGVELPHADLEHEIRLLFADMDSVTWQTPSLDGRRYLDEDEVYLHGATFLLCATYPREPTEPWPDFTDLLEFAKRTIHTQAHTSDLLAIGTIVLAQGDVEAAEDLLADLDPGAEHSRQSLLRAACFLQRARWSGDAKAREALLTRAEAKLTSLKLDDWDRPYWAAWIDLLLQRGADPATQTEAEARWTGAEPGALGPVPYLLFDPERLHFLPDRGGGPLPFPPPR